MLFDTSVRKELARSFSATLVVILTIVLTMMLIRTLGMAASGMVAAQDVVLVMAYTSLGYLPTILTLSLFVGIVISLGRMYRDSEMAIWFSSGVGLVRFIRPVVRASWSVVLVIGLLALFGWPWANKKLVEIKSRYEQRSDLARVSPGSFQSSAGGNRVFFIERSGDLQGGSHNVFMLTNDEDHETVTVADTGQVTPSGDHQLLQLAGGQRNEFNRRTGEHVRSVFERFSMEIESERAQAAQSLPPKAVATHRLLRMTADSKSAGELAWRIGMVLAAINMMVLGIGTAATNPRRASNWNLMFALLGFAVYLNLLNLSQAWVGSGKFHLVPVLVMLHGLGLVFAVGLVHWRDHAAVLHLWPHRTTAGGAA